MKYLSLVSLLLVIAFAGWWAVSGIAERQSEKVVDDVWTEHVSAALIELDGRVDTIRLITPQPGEQIVSPLTIQGEVRGFWFFEASFPVVLVDWDGRIVAEGYASAADDWMTTDFVPFTASLAFMSPYDGNDPDFMRQGALILKRDNPSGLPEHDDSIEIPVLFEINNKAASVKTNASYGEAIDAAKDAASLLGQ